MDWKEIANFAVVLLFGGAIWKLLNDKFDGKAASNKALIDLKVDRAYCKPTHDALIQGVGELKADNKEIKTTLAEIQEELAIMNGAEIERARIEKERRKTE